MAKIRDLAPVAQPPVEQEAPYGVFSRFDEFENLLANEISIERTDGQEMDYNAEIFAKRALIERGQVGYDKITDKFYYSYGQGINDYGNALSIILITAKGRSLTRKACYDSNPDGAYIIKAFPFGFVLASLIRETTDFMTNCDLAMRQNLEACKTPYIVVCKDDNLVKSFQEAVDQKQRGQAVLVVSPDLGDGLKAVNIGTEFLVDKFEQVRDTERDTLLNKLGILTANTDKRERVQSAEVNATIGQATDYIYLLIDTFNKQCETYALPFEMKYNGSMEEIYLDEQKQDEIGEEKQEVDVNDVEKGNEIK